MMKTIKRFNEFKLIKENTETEEDINSEIYNELEMRISNQTGLVPQQEIFDVAEMYGKEVEDILDILSYVYTNYNKEKSEHKEDELETLGEFAYISCNILGDTSYECFEKEYLYQINNSHLEENTKQEAIDKSKEVYEDIKKSYSEETTKNTIESYEDDIKALLEKHPNKSSEYLAEIFDRKNNIFFSPRTIIKLIEIIR